MRLRLNRYVVSNATEKHGHTCVQWFIAFLGALVFVTVGLLVGWVSPMKKILQSDASPTGSPLTDTEMSGIASTLTLAAIVGLPAFSWISEAYGRKAAIQIIIAMQMLCWITKLTANNAAILIVARAISGIAYGGTYLVIPMYVREISQDNLRGLLGTLVLSSQYIGVLAMYAMGSYLSYYRILWIVLCYTIVTSLLIQMVPESPAFLVKKGKFDVAAKTVATLRRLHEDDVIVQNEINYMKDEDARYKSTESISMNAIFKNKAWLRGILLCQVLVGCVALNGTFGIITYALSIMTEAGITVNPELQSLIVPFLLMCGTIVPVIFVERAGRKPLLAGTFVISGLSMTCFASALLAQQSGVVVPSWVLMLSIAVVVKSYSAGIVSMPTIIMIDMFRFQVRAKIMSPIMMFTLLLVSIYLAVFDPISKALGLHTMFYISAGVNFFGAGTVFLWLPETKGKTVDQIEAMLVGNKRGSAPNDSSDVANATCKD